MAKEYIERSAIKYEQWAVGPLNAPLMVVRKKTIDSIPAADVVEVRHELWVHDYNNLYGCTGCGERETMSRKKMKKFCPNCGARMDGE